MVSREIRVSLLDLLFLPVAAPVKGFMFVLNEVRIMADREMNDPVRLQEKLMEIQVLYEIGEMDEVSYREAWSQIIQRLSLIRRAGGEMSDGQGD